MYAWLWLDQQEDGEARNEDHAPASATERGSERTDAKTPSEVRICHNPGSIHTASGANLQSSTANNTPAMPAGRNCSTAWWIMASARPE